MAKIQIQDLEPQSFISEVDANELENVQGGFWWLIVPAIVTAALALSKR